jgi:protein ImuB
VLWTCVFLPDLCLQALGRADAREVAFAVSTRSLRPDLIACSSAAQRMGVAPGMSVAAALACAPGLDVRPRDEQREARALHGLALWACQFTPTVSLAFPHGVLLEVEASLAWLGGFRSLLGRLARELRELGWDALLASAPAPSAALLLARAGLQVHTRDPARAAKHLGALPLAFLTCAREALPTFATLGIAHIEDLLALPAEGVARRFGQPLLDEIRRARDELPDPVAPFEPPERYANRIELPVPVAETEPVLFALKRLLRELEGFLRARGSGVTRLRLALEHEEVAPTELRFGLAATRDAEHILRVLRERLAREALPDRVEAIALESVEIVPLQPAEADLFPGAAQVEEARVQLFERLRARLGEDALRMVRTHSDHRPECAWRWSDGAPAETQPLPAVRPLWLLARPRPLPEGPARLALAAGPERIEAGWWDGADIGRDYFVGRSERGEQWWLYRDREGRWFVHGVFG